MSEPSKEFLEKLEITRIWANLQRIMLNGYFKPGTDAILVPALKFVESNHKALFDALLLDPESDLVPELKEHKELNGNAKE